MSFQVSEYRINELNEEKSYHYKMSRKKFIQYISEYNPHIKLVDEYPEVIEEGFCYVQNTGKMVWLKVRVEDVI